MAEVIDKREKATERLTKAQREVLQAMADGHVMAFSQDGDDAWLWPRHKTGFLSHEQTVGLRELGYIASAPASDDEEENVRFGPGDIITEAGRTALSTIKNTNPGEKSNG